MSTKFVFVTGGVVSGLGKGICAASLGRLLKQRGVRVRNQKFDPYIKVDPGTMMSKKTAGLFFAGEILDLDAYTGGFNLQIAWCTGRAAGEGAARYSKEERE